MTSTERFDVVNGPSRWDLMLSLFSVEPHLVTFEVLIPSRVLLTVSVTGVLNMGDEWVITAQVVSVECLSSSELKEINPEQQESIIHPIARIHTRTEGNRHGTIWFIPPGKVALKIKAAHKKAK
jgi:hypothetical protein